jgi:nitrogen PTS system EIIA component
MTDKGKTSERLMTLQEVAEYTQIKERTLYLWAQQGRIPSFKLGDIWRFKRDDIENWIEERKRDTPRTQKKKARN